MVYFHGFGFVIIPPLPEIANFDTNKIYDGVEAETRKSQASFQII